MGGKSGVGDAVKKDIFNETVTRTKEEKNEIVSINFDQFSINSLTEFDFNDLNPHAVGSLLTCPRISANFFTTDDQKAINLVALCDTGASFSAISTDAFEKGQAENQLAKAVRQRGDPSQADNSKLICDGETITNISLRAISGKVIKLLNVRMTIIRNLSHQAILGIDVLGKLEFQVKTKNVVSMSDTLFRTERHISVMNSHVFNFGDTEMTVTQLSLRHRPFLPFPDTNAALYGILDGSGSSFNYFCCVDFCNGELETDVKINMLHNSVKSEIQNDELEIINLNFGKLLWSGPCTLNALNDPVNKTERKLISENRQTFWR